MASSRIDEGTNARVAGRARERDAVQGVVGRPVPAATEAMDHQHDAQRSGEMVTVMADPLLAHPHGISDLCFCKGPGEVMAVRTDGILRDKGGSARGPHLGTVPESVDARVQHVSGRPNGLSYTRMGYSTGVGRLAVSTAAATNEFSDTPTRVPSNALP